MSDPPAMSDLDYQIVLAQERIARGAAIIGDGLAEWQAGVQDWRRALLEKLGALHARSVNAGRRDDAVLRHELELVVDRVAALEAEIAAIQTQVVRSLTEDPPP